VKRREICSRKRHLMHEGCHFVRIAAGDRISLRTVAELAGLVEQERTQRLGISLLQRHTQVRNVVAP
jgi:hypothetical protein